MQEKTKTSVLAEIIISLILGLALGAVLLWFSNLGVSGLINISFIVIGIIIIATNIVPLVRGIMKIKEKGSIFDIIVSIIAITLGVLMIVFRGVEIAQWIITIALVVYLIALPIVRIIIAPAKGEQFSKEWIRILVGAILVVFLPAIFGAADTIVHIILLVASIVVFVLTILSFVLSLVAYIKATDKTEAVETEAVETEATEETAE